MSCRPGYRRTSAERDDWYRQECDRIAYSEGVTVRAEDGVVYLDTADGSKELCRPVRKFWYETWLALKYRRPPA